MVNGMARVDGKNRKLKIRLRRRELLFVTRFLEKGPGDLQVFRRAQVLHLLHEGRSARYVAELFRMSAKGVRAIGWRYWESGFEAALHGNQRPGRVSQIDDDQRLAMCAMVAGPPPKGTARWTIRKAAAEAAFRGIVASISRETIRRILAHSP